MDGFWILFAVMFVCFMIYLCLRKETKEDKIVGKIYIYQDEMGDIQLYLEPNITPLEMSKRKTVSFDVELLDTRNLQLL